MTRLDLLAAMLAAAIGLVIGLATGIGFFALLRASVVRLPSSAHPALLMVASLLARMLLAGAAFLLVARFGGLPALIGALGGFIAARLWATGKATREAPSEAPREAPGDATRSGESS